MEYTIQKQKYTKNKISSVDLFLDNGDHIELKAIELVDLSVNVYDDLMWNDKGMAPIAKDGFFKFKICNKPSFIDTTSHRLYNEPLFRKGRKTYIENRLTKESKITSIELRDKHYWASLLYGNFVCNIEGDFLMVNIFPQAFNQESDSPVHKIILPDITKEDIRKLVLDFESCDGITIYRDEILDLKLSFSKKLEWGASEFYRTIIGGYLLLDLEKDCKYRETFMFEDNPKYKDILYRICSKKGEDFHDICHLYISYYDAYRIREEECLEIADIRSAKELKKLDKLYDDDADEIFKDDIYNGAWYVGGYAKKLKNGNILITFGKNAKNECLALSKQLDIKKH